MRLLAPRLLLFPLRSPLFLQCLGRFLFLFFLSVHALAHDSLLVCLTIEHHFFAVRGLNFLRGFAGFSWTRLTFQVTHATDSDTNIERDFIVAELSKSRVIADPTSCTAGQQLSAGRVNHYVTDGEVTVATLDG